MASAPRSRFTDRPPLGLIDSAGMYRSGGVGVFAGKQVFANLPVESLVHQHQAAYYQALQDSTHATDCAPFIVFMLEVIRDALSHVAEKTWVETQVKTWVKIPEQILALLQQQPNLTLAEVAEQLGKSSSAIERAVAKLRQAGRLQRIGSSKNGHWQVHG